MKASESRDEVEQGVNESAVALEPAPAPTSRRRRWLFRSGQVMAGVVVALLLTECAFRWRDESAFPHVNLYVADAELGVRLAPGESEKIRFGGNPVTSIRINSEGYRGADFATEAPDEILVVGDSQVFGLGVEEGETFASQLAELTGRKVLNGGVPTYGPAEYTAVVSETLAKRKVKTVVYTVNFVNDLFEADRPNRERHKVWDGWAVRLETAPGDATWFPGRRWLMSKSHAVYALRRWLYERGPELDDRGFESEGTWKDVATVGGEASLEESKLEAKAAAAAAARNQRLAAIDAELEEKRVEIAKQMEEAFPDAGERLTYAGRSPGDIVSRDLARNTEASRDIRVTASHIRSGVAYRNQLAAKLNPRDASHRAAAAAVAAERDLQGERALLRRTPTPDAHVPSALLPHLRALKAITDKAGAELLVVALPIDVQVSDSEWEKYGVTEPIDMKPTRVLLRDLVRSAERLGARAVDVTAALERVEGAFLDKDIHMTPRGHRAVAEAIAARLTGPAAIALPLPGLPADRSPIPSQAEWRFSPEITVKGSSLAGCETFFVREWLRISCLPSYHKPSAIEVIKGGRGEALVSVTDDGATLTMPIVDGDEVEVTFYWTEGHRALRGKRDGSEALALAFDEAQPPGRPLDIGEADKALCACQLEVDPELRGSGDRCTNIVGAATPECMETYGDDCEALVLCARGDAGAPPPCPKGSANAGGSNQCFALCAEDAPCARGTCTPWQGTAICR